MSVGARLRALRSAGRVDESASTDRVVALAERLAVLLAAGVSAPIAWRQLASDDAAEPATRAAAVAAEEGEPVAAAIRRATRNDDPGRPGRGCGARRGRPPAEAGATGAWAAVAAAWEVANATGAPLALSLRELAAALRDDAHLRREVRAALAGPKASARLVTALPAIAVVLGLAMGFDTVGILFGNPLGWACLAVGGGLLWAGARWNRALAARAAPPSASPGLEFDLLAIAMSSGASLDAATEVTRRAMREHLPSASDAGADIAATVRLASEAGAPIAELLRSEAARRRRTARTDGATRAAALGVRLMLPLGACILPAFVLLGVAPLMISVVTGTLGGAS
ncbi:type II secretion system F family protein [Agromyces sp. G08B096]|uniref:Type II secretion system F family protein n=1 Tax=Agromyces sp. G08B096 TaxID=3156399 RepID=A0AAU7W505_9MICO